MDLSQVIMSGLTIVGGLLLGVYRREQTQLERQIDGLKKDVKDLQETRLHKSDFTEFKQEIREMFTEIKEDIRELRNHA